MHGRGKTASIICLLLFMAVTNEFQAYWSDFARGSSQKHDICTIGGGYGQEEERKLSRLPRRTISGTSSSMTLMMSSVLIIHAQVMQPMKIIYRKQQLHIGLENLPRPVRPSPARVTSLCPPLEHLWAPSGCSRHRPIVGMRSIHRSRSLRLPRYRGRQGVKCVTVAQEHPHAASVA